MSRLTGSDALGLFEAYQAVYNPQELTEEQVWEEVENWVNDLIEEGYDLSDYTWEDMYEDYGNIGGMLSGAGRAIQGALSGGYGGVKIPKPKSAPSAAPYKSRFSGARDAAVAKAQNIKGSPVVGPGKVGSGTSPGAPARPAATAAPKPATATTTAAKPAAATTPAAKPSAMDQFAKANPKLAAASAERDRTRGTSATTNPLMKDMKSRLPAPKTPSPTTAKTGFDLAKKGVNLAAGFDMFDVVKGYLIGEGYADTEEAALAIMTNMSEEWREDILAEAITSEKGKAKAAEMIAARSTPSGRAKSGKGANVARIRQIRGSGRGRFDREGLGGTPMTPTMAKNPIKKQNYDGTGNRAARRAGTYKESFNIFVNSMIAEGVSMERYTWEEIQNVFDDLFEAQVANRDPDEYERKAKQGQSREQQLKGRVMGRMDQMDPEKRKKMLAQMRAVGLDV